jgi:hypothetical protein
MANPPEMVMAKTLEATTQLCAEPVEMDNRESPASEAKIDSFASKKTRGKN